MPYNEVIKFTTYDKVLDLPTTDSSELICGRRYSTLSLCDPTVPNAEDI